jgi:hypothetical protein
MLYEEFLQAPENDWCQSTLYLHLIQRSKSSRCGRIVWLTRAQLLQKYTDVAIVDDLINRKRQAGDWQARCCACCCCCWCCLC